MLVVTGQLLPQQLLDVAVVGELALEGSVRPIKGALAAPSGGTGGQWSPR
jgi:predicted ATPase with chaperone activity